MGVFHVLPQETNSLKASEPEQSPTHKKPGTLGSKVGLSYIRHFYASTYLHLVFFCCVLTMRQWRDVVTALLSPQNIL